ncbi:neuroblast differentiation-associated protein AHNAK [Mobula hypostoma]|uniref:neuroblast differentiation-associated protein AHNAK n=1 Tax=Mobula hypostoma TaxID=723540 RepID=UPI002FC3B147
MAKKDDDLDVLLPNWSGAAAHGFTISGSDDGIFIKDVIENSPAGKSGVMKEGDQIVSATIYFDEMGYEEAQKILQTVDRHTVGLKLHRKGERLSPGGSYSWDPERYGATSPDAVLSGDDEDYQRIFRKKIKPRLKSEDGAEASVQDDGSSGVRVTRKVITRTVHVTSPTVMTDVDIHSPEFKIKVPRHEQVTAEGPGSSQETSEMDVDVSLAGSEGLKFQMGDSQRTTHTMHIVKTKVVEVTGPDTEQSKTTFHMPQISIGGEASNFDVKIAKTVRDSNVVGEDVAPKVSLPESSIDVSAPHVTMGVQVPAINPSIAIQSVHVGDSDGRISMPSVKMPEVAISGSHVRSPNAVVDTGAVKSGVALPKVNLNLSGNQNRSTDPIFDVQTPKVHVENSSFNMQDGKRGVELKEPKLNISASIGKDISTDGGEIKWRTPEGPEMYIHSKLPEGNIESIGPKIKGDIELSDKDLASSKIKDPTFKISGVRFSGSKQIISDTEIKHTKVTEDFDAPKVSFESDIKVPSVNIKGPKIDVEATDVKESGHGLAGSAMNLPKIKTTDIDLGVKVSKVKEDHGIDVASRRLEGKIKGPQMDIEVDIPEAESEGGSVKVPKFRIPKFRTSGPKVEGPDVDIHASLAEADVKITKPTVEGVVEMPKVDMGIEGASTTKGTKFSMPAFNVSVPKIGRPDVNLDIKQPEVGEDIDISDVKLQGDIKGPRIHLDGLDVKAGETKISRPNIKLDLKGPKIEGDVNVPDVQLEGDIKAPNLDIRAPNVDIGSFELKGSGPKISMPSIHLPEIQAPELGLNLKGPKMKGDYDIDVPSGKVEGEIKGPKVDVDVDVPGADVEGGGKFSMPKFRIPKFQMRGPKVEGTDFDIDTNLSEAEVKVSGPQIQGDVEMPDVDVDVEGGGKIKGSRFKMPGFNISGPKLGKPDFNLDFKGPRLSGNVDVPDVKLEGDIKGPNIDIKGPEIDIEGPDVKGGKHKFSVPSIHLPKIQAPDIDLNLKGPNLKGDYDIDVPSGKVEGEIKGPKVDVDVDVPGAEVEGGGKFSMPKFKMPKFQIGGPKLDGSDVDIHADLPESDVTVSGPQIEGDVEMPDVDVDVEGGGKVKGSKFKMPGFNISGPKMGMPDFNLDFKGPRLSGDVDVPDVKLEGDIKGPNVDIKGPEVDIEGPDVKGGKHKFSMPSIHLPKIQAPDIDLRLKGPNLKGDSDIDVPSGKVEGEIKGPKVDVDLDVPGADVEGGGKFSMPKFKMPKFQMRGPKVEGPDVDIDTNLPEADVKVSAPQIEGDVEMPDVDVDVEGGGKIKGSRFKMPGFNISGPKIGKPDFNLDFKGPKLSGDVDVPEVKLEGDIKAPEVDIEGPDVKGGKHKFSMPSIHLPKIQAPDIDLNLKGPKLKGDYDIDVPLGKMEGEIKGPKVDVDVDVPGAEVEGGGKFSMPKFKMLKFRIGGPKMEGSDVDIHANIPETDVKISGPQIEGDVEMPDVDVDVEGGSKIKGSRFKMPGFNISGPKLGKPDFNLDFKGPKLSGDVDVPDVKLEGDIKGPNVDIKGPEVDIEGPDVKGGKHKFSMPSIHLPKIQAPDIDLNLKGPKLKGDYDVDVPSGKVEGEIKGPKVDVDVDVPGADVEGGGKFSMPKFKMPKFRIGGPKVEGPDVDIDGNLPESDVKISGPQIEGDVEMPDVDIDVEGGGKVKGSKFKMPGFNISGPKIGMPDFNLDFKGPKLSGDVDVPDVKLGGDIKGPDVDIKGPEVDIEGPDVKGGKHKFSMPSIHLPKIQAPDIDLNLKGPKLKGDYDVDVPSGKVEGEIKGPKVDVDVPGADVEGGGKFSMPKFKMPKFRLGGPKLESPDVNIDANIPEADVKISGPQIEGDVEMPDVDMDVEGGGKLKGSRFKMPGFNISAPNIGMPDFNLDFKGPKFGGDVDIPDVKLEGDIKGPKVDVETPDIKGKGPKISMPSINLPKIQAPDIDLSLKGPNLKGDYDFHVPSGKVEGEIKGPKVDVDVDVPGADVEGGGKFSLPKFKMPKFRIGGPKVGGPDVDIDANIPEADVKVSGPKIEGDVEMPDVDVDVEGGGKIKGSRFKMPGFNISAPKIGLPDFNLDVKGPKWGGDIDIPDVGLEGDIKGPSLDVKGPKVDVETPDIKGKGAKISMPSIHLPKFQAPDIDFNLKGPKLKGDYDIDVPSGKVEGEIKGPDVDVDVPGADVEGGGKFSMPKFKMPKFQMRGPKVEGPDVDIDANIPEADVKVSGPKIEGDVEMPDVDVDVEGGGKIKGSRFKMPGFNISAPKIGLPDFNLDLKGPKWGGDVDVPDISLEGDMKGPSLDIKGPNVDIESPDIKGTGPKISMPSIHLPKFQAPDIDFNLKGPKLKGDYDVDVPSGKVEGEIKGPKVDVDVDVPGAEVEGGGKFSMPKFKMPKFRIGGTKVKGPELDLGAKLPETDVKISGPQIEGDVQVPDVDVDVEGGGKIKGSKFKMPGFNISGPKIGKPDFNLDFKGPKLSGDVDVPDVKLEGDIKGPNVDIKVPEVDIEGPDVKGGKHKFSMPSIHLPKIQAPDIDLSLKGPNLKGDYDIDAPSGKVQGEIKGPEVDVDLDVPGADVEGGGKFSMPKFKLPKFQMRGPKIEGPDFDIDANIPEADVKVSGPKIEGDVEMPDVDVDVEGGGKIKGSRFKMPGFNISGPKIGKPDFNLDFKGPKLSGDVDVPEVKLEGDIKGPNVDIKGPEVDIEGPDVKGGKHKFSMPSIHLPKIQAPDIDLNLKGPKLKGDYDVDVPSGKVEGEIKGPKVDVDVDLPGADVEGGGKFSMPKFKMPKFQMKGPKVEGPDVDIDANIPEADVKVSGPQIEGDVEMPDVDVDVEGGGKIKGSRFKMPGFNISAPKIGLPDMNLDLKGPRWGGDVTVPDVSLEGDMKGPSLDIKGPNVDVETPDIKGKGPKISLPSIHLPKIQAPDIDLNLKGPKLKGDYDVDVPSGKVEGEIKGPKVDVDVNVPGADVEGGGKFSMPKFKMPKFQMRGPKVEGPDVDIDTNIPKADVKVSGPQIGGDVEMPDVDVDVEGGGKVKGSRFKMPGFNISGPKIGMPDFNLDFKGPKMSGDVDVPDVKLEGDVKGPEVELEGPDVKGGKHKFSMPSIHLPKIQAPDIDLSLKGPNLKGDYDVDASSGKVEGEFEGPKVDVDLDVPGADVEGGGKFSMPKFKMPKFRIGGPKVKGPDMEFDANLPETDVKISGPQVKGDIEMPDVDVEGGGKIKGSRFKMPGFNISGPKIGMPDFNLDFKGPKLSGDVDVPDVKMEGDIKGPNVDIKGPEVDIEEPDVKGGKHKFSMPSIHLPKIQAPDIDFNLKGPNLKGDYDIDVPSRKVEGEIKGPDVDVDVQGADVEGGGKFSMPKFKMPKFQMRGPKLEGSDVLIDTDIPEADVKVSGPQIKGDVEMPDVDVDVEGGGKVKGSRFKMPGFNISAPKIGLPDFNLDVKGPKWGGDIDIPDVGLEGDIKGPSLDVKGPKVDVETPDIKGKGAKISMPSIHLPKFQAPDIDFNLKGPKLKGDYDIDVPSGKVEGEIKGPKVDVDVDVPGADVEGGGKFSMPKFKMPKFRIGGPKLEGPDVDIDGNLPESDVKVSGPKIEGDVEMPDVDVDVEGGGKIKGSRFKMPGFNISGPKIGMPDFNLDFKGPKLSGDVDVPDVKLEGDIKGPNVDIKGPEVDIEGPDVKGGKHKFSMPSIHLPKIQAPDIDLNLKGPKLKGDYDIDVPSGKVQGEIKGPKVDVDLDVPGADVEGGGKFSMPKFKMPKFQMRGPKVEGPDVDIDANIPEADVKVSGPQIEGDVEMPDVDVDVEGGGKIKGSRFKMPGFNISGPKIGMPDFNLDFKGPRLPGDVDVPDVKMEGDIKGPNVDIKGPEVDIEGPDLKGGKHKFSMPSIHLPKIQAPDIDLRLKGPNLKGDSDIDVPSGKVEGEIKGPKIDVDVDVPGADVEGGGKFSFPKFKMPKFRKAGPKVQGPDLDIDGNFPDADVKVSGPKVEGDVKMPDVNIDVGESGKLKSPKFKLPGFSISAPKIGKPDVNVDLKGPKVAGDVDVPDVNLEGDIKGPNVKGPKVDIEGPDVKGSGLKFSMPSFHLPKIHAPDVDLSFKSPKLKGDCDINVPSGKIEGEVKAPKVDVDVDVPGADVEGGSGKFSFPKFRMPKFHMGASHVGGPDLEIGAKLPEKDIKLSGPQIEGDVELPDVDVDVEGGGKIKAPKIKMPELNISAPKIGMPDINLDLKGPKVGGDIDGLDIKLEGDVKGPKVDIEAPDIKGSGAKFSMPSIHLPKIQAPNIDLNFRGPKGKGDYDINVPSGKVEGEIKGPKVDVDVDVPGAEVEGGGKFSMPKFKLPKFQMGVPKVEGPDVNIDANIPEADVKVSGPQIEGDVKMPDVGVDVEGGGKIKGSRFKMPGFNISAPKIGLPDMNLDLKGPKWGGDVTVPDVSLEGDMKGPSLDIKGPNVDVETPDIKGKGPKISLPSIHLPKIQAPDIDLNLKGPKLKGDYDVDVPSGKVEGEIKGPKVDVDVNVPGADVEGGGKFSMPKFKMPKFQMRGPKVEGPDVDIDTNIPKADVKVSGPQIEGDVEMPDVDVDVEGGGKVKGSRFKMPGFNISGPKIGMPDFNLDFKGPKMSGDVDVPDVKLEGDVKGPEVELEGPDVKGGKHKFSMPSIHLPKIQAPDIDLSLKGPNLKGDYDVDASSGKVEGEFKGPKVDVDLDVPGADVEGGGKFNMPKFKMPKFQMRGPKVEGPDVDIDANIPEADVKVSGPKIEGDVEMPDVDVDVEGGGKVKGSKFKMPGFNISGPKIGMPDFNLDFKGPTLSGDVDVPDVKLEGDIKGPNVDIKGPEVDIEGPDVKGGKHKFSMPSIHLPKIQAPDIDLNLKGPKLKGDYDVDVPSGKVEGEFEGPKVDVDLNVPGADVEGGGKFSMPKFKMPKFQMRGPKVGGPDVDIDANIPEADVKVSGPKIEGDVEMPDVDVDVEGGGKVKGSRFKMPGFNISGPKIGKPDFNLDFKGPKLSGDVDVPDVKLEGDIKGPNVDIKGPEVDIEGPDVKGGKHKFSMPSIHLPKIQAPDIDLNLKGPKLKGDYDVDVPSGKVEGEFEGPKVDFDLNVPGADVEGGGKFSMPKFKMPKFQMRGPKVGGPDVDIDANIPEADVKVSGPKIEGDVEMPDVDVDVEGGGKVKGSRFKMPGFNISGPKIGKPDFNLDFKGPKLSGDVDVPDVKLEGDIKGPNVDIKGPEVDIEGLDVKGGKHKFSMPSIHLPKIQAPDIDLNLKGPKLKGDYDVDVPSGKVEGEIKGPKVDVDVDVPGVDVEGGGKFSMPKFKMPKFQLRGPKVEGPDVGIDADLPETDVKLSGPKIEGDVKTPNVDVEGSGKINSPKFKIPGFSMSPPKIGMPDFNLELKGPKMGGEIEGPHVGIDTTVPEIGGKLSGPKSGGGNISGIDIDVEGASKSPKFKLPGLGISAPKIEMPDFNLELKGPKLGGHIDAPDPNLEGELKGPQFEMKGPKVGIEGSDMNIEGPDLKGNGHKFSAPSLDISAPSADMNLDLKGSADIKPPGFGIDVNAPGMEIGSEGAHLKTPKVKKPKFGFGVKGQGDINAHSLDVASPDVEVNVESPDASIKTKGKKGKFRLPKLNIKSKKPGGDMKANVPKSDLDLSKPDVDMKSPDLNVSLGASDGQLNIKPSKVKKPLFGKVKVSFPDVEFDLASPKIKGELPTAKAEGGLQGPDVEFSSEGIKGPQVDIGAPGIDVNTGTNLKGPGLKIKGTKLKFPAVNIKSPKMTETDMDINLKGAQIKGDASGNVEGPRIGAKRPEIDFDVDAPNVDIEKPEGKLKMKVKKPNISGPNVNLDTSGDAEGKLKIPKVKLPGFGVDGKLGETDTDINVSLPKAELSSPKLEGNIDMPSTDISIRAPGVKMPEMDISDNKLQGSGLNLDIHAPKIEGDLKTPRLGATVEVPDVGISADGKFKGPQIGISAPDVGVDLKTPQLGISLPSPSIKGAFKGPQVDVKGPVINTGDGDFNIKGVGGKVKMPQIHIPEADISIAGSGVSAPDLSRAKTDIDIKSPKMNIEGPSMKLNGADVNIDSLKGKLPNIGLAAPKPNIELPGAEVEGVNTNVSLGSLSADVPQPEVKVPSADVKLDVKGPSIKGGIGMSGLIDPGFDAKASEVSTDVKAPTIDLDVALDKMKIPKFKHSQFKMKGPNLEEPEAAADVRSPEIQLHASAAQGPDVKGPEVSLNLPGEVETSGVKVKKSRIKLPKFNFSKSKGKSSCEGSEGDFGASGPKTEIKGSKGNLGFGNIEVETSEMSTAGKDSSLDINTSPKGKSGTLDFSLFKGKRSERHRSASLSDEQEHSPSSPTGKLEFGEGTAGGKGKKAKLKFGTFGGFGAKSKGSYEVTLDEGEAGVEGSGTSLVSKKSRVSSTSSSDSGSKVGLRLPKVELNINKDKE